ncbi:MAG: hypothetical protein M8467_03980 [Anaerolineae bacterium]|nr:hypothetical protein [Anaerolineae bacterium]
MAAARKRGSRPPGEQEWIRREVQAKAWLRARARLVPNLLPRSPGWVRSRFEHAWAPMEALSQQVRLLPADLWEVLLGFETGFVAISNAESRYLPGPAMVNGREVHNVAIVSVEALARDNEQPLHVIGHLIDHHLGCGGTPEGAWLSEGGGVRPRWQEAGQRLLPLFALGYAVDEVAAAGVRDYLAQSLALYCRERQRLNVADPQIYKWLRSTLWHPGFWRVKGERA